MQWDGSKAFGPVLYESSPQLTAESDDMEKFFFNTSGLDLTPGQQYVAFFNSSNATATGSGRMGYLSSSAAYSGGQFVYSDNFSNLTTSNWSTNNGGDLAFELKFASPGDDVNNKILAGMPLSFNFNNGSFLDFATRYEYTLDGGSSIPFTGPSAKADLIAAIRAIDTSSLSATEHTIIVTVTDSLGGTDSEEAKFTIVQPTTITGLDAVTTGLGEGDNMINPGGLLSTSVNITPGGVPIDTYRFSISNTNTDNWVTVTNQNADSTIDATDLVAQINAKASTLTNSGNYTLKVKTIDSLGEAISNPSTFTVNDRPAVTNLNVVSEDVTDQTQDLGNLININTSFKVSFTLSDTADITGGLKTYAYSRDGINFINLANTAVSIDPNDTTKITLDIPGQTESGRIYVQVTDALGMESLIQGTYEGTVNGELIVGDSNPLRNGTYYHDYSTTIAAGETIKLEGSYNFNGMVQLIDKNTESVLAYNWSSYQYNNGYYYYLNYNWSNNTGSDVEVLVRQTSFNTGNTGPYVLKATDNATGEKYILQDTVLPTNTVYTINTNPVVDPLGYELFDFRGGTLGFGTVNLTNNEINQFFSDSNTNISEYTFRIYQTGFSPAGWTTVSANTIASEINTQGNLLAIGNYTLEIKAIDSLGLESNVVSDTFDLVNNALPTFSTINFSGSAYVVSGSTEVINPNTNFTATFTISDADNSGAGNITKYEYSFDNTNWTQFSGQVGLNTLNNLSIPSTVTAGNKNMFIRVTDPAGFTNTQSESFVLNDIPVVAPDNTTWYDDLNVVSSDIYDINNVLVGRDYQNIVNPGTNYSIFFGMKDQFGSSPNDWSNDYTFSYSYDNQNFTDVSAANISLSNTYSSTPYVTLSNILPPANSSEVYVKVTDSYGLESIVYSSSITINTAPEATISTPNDLGTFNLGGVNAHFTDYLKFVDAENNMRNGQFFYKVYENGTLPPADYTQGSFWNGWSWYTPLTNTLNQEINNITKPGDYIIELKVADELGFQSSVITETFTLEFKVDAVADSVTNTYNAYNQNNNLISPGTALNLQISGNEISNSTFSYKLDGTISSPTSFNTEAELLSAVNALNTTTPLSNGNHSLEIIVTPNTGSAYSAITTFQVGQAPVFTGNMDIVANSISSKGNLIEAGTRLNLGGDLNVTDDGAIDNLTFNIRSEDGSYNFTSQEFDTLQQLKDYVNTSYNTSGLSSSKTYNFSITATDNDGLQSSTAQIHGVITNQDTYDGGQSDDHQNLYYTTVKAGDTIEIILNSPINPSPIPNSNSQGTITIFEKSVFDISVSNYSDIRSAYGTQRQPTKLIWTNNYGHDLDIVIQADPGNYYGYVPGINQPYTLDAEGYNLKNLIQSIDQYINPNEASFNINAAPNFTIQGDSVIQSGEADINIVASANPTYDSVIQNDLPIAYWELDEVSGTVVNSSVGNLNGTYVGGVSLGESNSAISDPGDNAVRFDGINDYIDLPDISSDFSQGISIEFWIKNDTNIADYYKEYTIIELGNPGGTDIVAIRTDGSEIWYEVNGSSYYAYTSSWNSALTYDQWQHFVFTQDSSGKVNIYRNGFTTQDEGYIAPLGNISRTENFIGKGQDPTSRFMGSLDNVAIYNKVLTFDQAKQHYEVTQKDQTLDTNNNITKYEYKIDGVHPDYVTVDFSNYYVENNVTGTLQSSQDEINMESYAISDMYLTTVQAGDTVTFTFTTDYASDYKDIAFNLYNADTYTKADPWDSIIDGSESYESYGIWNYGSSNRPNAGVVTYTYTNSGSTAKNLFIEV